MLEVYKEKQPRLYKLLSNAIDNNKYSHAYLFEGDRETVSGIALAFAKAIICPLQNKCNDGRQCNICNRIDNGNYTEIIIVEPEGMQIKKEQLLYVQEMFSKKPIEGNSLVYIIKECEKMNKFSANAILKLLEEPADDIVAILLTNNINKVVETVASRCQIIRISDFKNEDNDFLKDNKNTDDKKYAKMLENTFAIVEEVEKNGYNAVVDTKKHLVIFTKNKSFNVLFEMLLLIYEEAFNYKVRGKIYRLKEQKEKIVKIAKNNNLSNIAKKIEAILDIKENMGRNLNGILAFDKFLMKVDGDKSD